MAKAGICSESVPNFIVRADGSPSLIHAGSTVDGIEYTHKNFNFYAYYGGITGERNTALDANGTTLIGYGYKGSANSQNRATQEVTFGLTHTMWRDAKYGALSRRCINTRISCAICGM